MPVTIMAKNYANCPLKKRPIVFNDDDLPDEPENLSTKPEDLSITGRLTSVSPQAISSPESDPRVSPVSSISISSPPPSPTQFYPTITPIKVEPRIIAYPPPISPEYAPTTWHRSVYHPGGYHYLPYPYGHHHETMYVTPSTSPYSDSSLSPPHHIVQQPLQPLALRPTVYSSIDQNSLSPNSSTNSPPPQQTQMSLSSPEDLTEKRNINNRNAGIRHQCPDCGKSYSTFSGLSKHRQFHCAAGDGPKKSFSCKHCDKVYVSLGALKMHIRTHTLPCKCTICGKAFSRPWLLQGHIRTHTGEKPFSCTYCNRAFADRSNLRAHLQTHSDVKKYSCPNCSKTFSRMSLLSKHAEGGCAGGTVLLQPEKMY